MLPQTYLPSRNQYAPNRHSNCISRALMSSSGSCYWRKIVHSKLFTDLFFEGVTPAKFHFDHTTAHLTEQIVDDRWLSCALFWSRICRCVVVEWVAFRLRGICYDWSVSDTCRQAWTATTCRRCVQIAYQSDWLWCWSAFSCLAEFKLYEFDLKVNRYLSCSILIYG